MPACMAPASVEAASNTRASEVVGSTPPRDQAQVPPSPVSISETDGEARLRLQPTTARAVRRGETNVVQGPQTDASHPGHKPAAGPECTTDLVIT